MSYMPLLSCKHAELHSIHATIDENSDRMERIMLELCPDCLNRLKTALTTLSSLGLGSFKVTV